MLWGGLYLVTPWLPQLVFQFQSQHMLVHRGRIFVSFPPALLVSIYKPWFCLKGEITFISKSAKIQYVLCFEPSLTRFQGWKWDHVESQDRFKATFAQGLNTPTADISCRRNPHTHTQWEVKVRCTLHRIFSEPRRRPVSIYPLWFLIWWETNAYSSKSDSTRSYLLNY